MLYLLSLLLSRVGWSYSLFEEKGGKKQPKLLKKRIVYDFLSFSYASLDSCECCRGMESSNRWRKEKK